MIDSIKQILRGTPIYVLYKNLQAKTFEINPRKFISNKYKNFYGTEMDFFTPQKLSEKIQLLKIYYYPNSKKVAQAADKYKLHTFLQEKGLEHLAVPYLQIYNKPDDFDMSRLPGEFVLKKTNASGLNLIVKDKNKITEKEIKKKLKYWFTFDYGKFSHEPHYSKATDRIICEPFFSNLGNEYRFFMVDGEIGFIQVIVWDWAEKGKSQRVNDEFIIEGHSKHYRLHFDKEWNLYWKDNDTPAIEISKPANFEYLKQISKKVAEDFPVVRVDFNEINGEVKISELTFTPASGYLEILKQRPDIDVALGEKLRIEDYFE
ncbi:ATP-grasp fold amidoligase family protein [Tetragenococcus halophilus]|uniref:ATP-grasp fold amidoligase family protein n=1 Tax=Tetragenococcus halophilus TaxID=51669 RepID=UPI00256A2EB2|nr:ATP-grasp fold amidoligase family protein [Tetragenococcus halophilus]GMG65978.1 hypothetical protein TEHIT2_11690 [Tetragenococcus halophilus]